MRPRTALVSIAVVGLCSLALAAVATARDPADFDRYDRGDREDRDRGSEPLEYHGASDRDWSREERSAVDGAPLEDSGWDDSAQVAPGEGASDDPSAGSDDPATGGLPGGGGGDASSGSVPDGGGGGGEAVPDGELDGPTAGGVPGVGTRDEEGAAHEAQVGDSDHHDIESDDPGPEHDDPASAEADPGFQDAEDGLWGEDGDRADGSPDAPDWDPTGIETVEANVVDGDDDAWDSPSGDLIPVLSLSLYWVALFLSGAMTP
jgi:hypothetical protein